jgi:hypothetical protein
LPQFAAVAVTVAVIGYDRAAKHHV